MVRVAVSFKNFPGHSENTLELELPEGSTVGTALDVVRVRRNGPTTLADESSLVGMGILRNGRFVSPSALSKRILADNDELVVFPLMGRG